MVSDEGGFLDTRRAAANLGLSQRTLDGYCVSRRGPTYHRFGLNGSLTPRWGENERSANPVTSLSMHRVLAAFVSAEFPLPPTHAGICTPLRVMKARTKVLDGRAEISIT